MDSVIVFIPDKRKPENKTIFKLTPEFWSEMYHSLAFLAESGKGQIKVMRDKEREIYFK